MKMSVECEIFSGMAQLLSSGNSVNVLLGCPVVSL